MTKYSGRKAIGIMILAVALLLVLADSLGLLQQNNHALPQADAGGVAANDRTELQDSGSGAENLFGYSMVDDGWAIPDGAVIVPGETVSLFKPEKDGVDLHNSGSEPINFSDYGLADGGWTISDGTGIVPAEEPAIYC